jgi:hypothetical protein
MQKIVRAATAFARKMKLRQQEGFSLSTSRVVIPLVLVGALCVSAPSRAGDQVPFKGSFSPIIVSATPLDATHVLLEVDVPVRATQLGNARGPGSFILDMTTLAYSGEATWAAANGDAVFFTFAGQFVPTATPGILENVETFEVVGGTGRFEGATGGGVAGGLLDVTLVPLTPAPFEGTISSPGSLKK